jgi:hypothetical protein
MYQDARVDCGASLLLLGADSLQTAKSLHYSQHGGYALLLRGEVAVRG